MEDNRIFRGNRYTSLDSFWGGWFFGSDGAEVSHQDLESIKPLSEEYSAFLWDKYVSPNGRHLALLGSEDFLFQLEKVDYNWLDDWNEGSYDAFSAYLNRRLQVDRDAEMFFFWMREHSVETVWGVFLRNWISFLFEDEGPILIIPSAGAVVSFKSDGSLFVGRGRA